MSLTEQSDLTPEQVAANFADIKPPLAKEHAITESNRCLYCYDAPCAIACPTHIDIPEFIRRIGSGNLKGAAETILEANILGASCARVCPTQELCEGACVMNQLQQPAIDIGRLQRYAIDHVMDNNIPVLQPLKTDKGAPVAVIGGGPAGLSVAAELSRLGHPVTVFEANKEAGGLNRYGIAPYKLTNEEAQAEVKYVQDMCKFDIKTGVRVGQDITLDQLEKDYAAIFLGVGVSSTRKMGIPGENLAGFIGATEWIEELRSKPLHETQVGSKVIVVGAGNTAIDAATEASRLGADVVIVYRRGKEDMPAYEFEYHLALQDRVRFFWHTNPVAVLGTDKVTGLRCQKMAAGEADSSGRPRPVPVEGSDFELEADWVILATGQENHKSLYETLKLEMSGSKVKVNDQYQTSNPKYFAGGDAINGGKEVVNAVADGKRAAHAIHEILGKKG